MGNVLLSNDGAGGFTEIVGPDGSIARGAWTTYGVVLADFTDTGRLDVVFGNTGSTNQIFRFTACLDDKTARSSGYGCVSCPQPWSHRDGARDRCVECPAHQALDFSGTCSTCPPGFARELGQESVCGKCPLGSAQTGGEATDCNPCDAGWYSPFEGSILCFPCATGSYSQSTGTPYCTSCEAGKFSSEIGQSGCSLCPIGGFCATAGAASVSMTFEQCPAGTFNPSPGATSNASCIGCPVGKASPIPGSSSETVCTACLPGS
jgi:hypothetical protein